jgi:hypothetical protein
MSDDEGSSVYIAFDAGDGGESLVQATLHDDGTMSYEVVWLPADDSTEEGQEQ